MSSLNDLFLDAVCLVFHPGSPTDRIIPERKASAIALDGSRKRSKQPTPGLNPAQRLLVEYKPFEPAFYHTDIADWGMAFLLARNAGPQAYVLVDTGHHYQAQNIEQIVAWLLASQNDRRISFQRSQVCRR